MAFQSKTKIIRRIVLGLCAVWIILLAMLYISTDLYRDHAIRLLKNYLNKKLATEIVINKNNISLSIFKKFPKVSIELKDILVLSSPGPDYSQFTQTTDTLLFAHRLFLVFNLRSFLSKTYVLNKIEVNEADLNLLRDTYGNSNYQIFKENRKSDKPSDSITINLNKIYLNKVKFRYNDRKVDAILKSYLENAEISGNFIDENFELETSCQARTTNLSIDSCTYLSNQNLSIDGTVNYLNKVYSFSKGTLAFDGAKLKVSGTLNNDKETYSLVLQGKSIVLNRIKIKYLKDLMVKLGFTVEKGSLDLDARIAGSPKFKYPSVEVKFALGDLQIFHSGSGFKLSEINTTGRYSNGKSRNPLSSIFILDAFEAQGEHSEYNLNCIIKNFDAPFVSGRVAGKIDLADWANFEFVSKRVHVSGQLLSEISFKGPLPAFNVLTASDLKKLNLAGSIELIACRMKSLINHIPEAEISGKISMKSFSQINLENISVTTGKSDLLINGQVTDLPMFSNQRSTYPLYRCKVVSENFNVDDFLPAERNKKGEILEVHLPDSLVVFAKLQAKTFSFGKFKATDVMGNVEYFPRTLQINDFSMKSLGGKLTCQTEIVEQNKQINCQCDAKLQAVDIGDMFYTFNNFTQTVIRSENIDGSLTGIASVTSVWDLALKPKLEKLKLQSEITIENGELINYQPLMSLSDFIDVDELKHIKFNKLQSSVSISDQVLTISETYIQSSAISLIGSGLHRFDNSYAYKLQVQLSDVLWGKAKKRKPENTEFGYVVDDGLGRTTIPLYIIGKGTDFNVKYDKETARDNFREKLKTEKQAFKNLINSSENKEEKVKAGAEKIDWEEDSPKPANGKKEMTKKDSGTKNKNDFMIEWKDE